MSDIYAELLLEAAKYPEHYGLLTQHTAAAKSFNASCGDQIEVTLALDGEIITDVGWQGQGCVISKAHMSALSEAIIGKSREQVLNMSKSNLLAFFGFDEGLSPGREKCLMIGLSAVQIALKQ